MSIQIGAKPDAGFDNPLGMLADCHRRVERFLSILCRVAERAPGRALNQEEREAVEAALHYFREAGPRHTRDEEDSLFPRLRAHGAKLVEVDRLEGEHREAELLHEQTDTLYVRWINAGALSFVDQSQLSAATRQSDREDSPLGHWSISTTNRAAFAAARSKKTGKSRWFPSPDAGTSERLRTIKKGTWKRRQTWASAAPSISTQATRCSPKRSRICWTWSGR